MSVREAANVSFLRLKERRAVGEGHGEHAADTCLWAFNPIAVARVIHEGYDHGLALCCRASTVTREGMPTEPLEPPKKAGKFTAKGEINRLDVLFGRGTADAALPAELSRGRLFPAGLRQSTITEAIRTLRGSLDCYTSADFISFGLNMDSPSTDRSLMRRLRNGDKLAADQLHSRYSSRLRGLVKGRWNRALSSRVDIDDIVQSALGSFFRAARQGAYKVPQGGELWQLLAAITRHKLSHARVKHLAAKRDARRTVSCRETVGSLAGEEERLAQELRLSIEDIIRDFSPTERKIVELRIEGYELHDIAERTSRSRRTVERVLQGFREDLLRAYQADRRD